MRIAVFGAGAIGGLLAVPLAQGGHEVTVIARGENLAAIRSRGLILLREGREEVARVTAIERAAEAGPQDFVIVALKAAALPSAAPELARLLGPETTLVTAMNGIPYWYFHGMPNPPARSLESVDPGGRLLQLLPPERALGCIVYPAAERTAPGVITHVEGDRFSLGEPDGSRSERSQRFAEALIGAGFKAPVRRNLRDELWVKLLGNAVLNPISALTRATLDRIVGDAGTHALAHRAMEEAASVATALGIRLGVTIEQRLAGAGAVGAHKTSMLQDLEQGRPLELEALTGAVIELGRLTKVATPTLEMIAALLRLRAAHA